ncbi:MAG: NAD(P)/FAD-dependent oxidoreductase [Frankia sp.]
MTDLLVGARARRRFGKSTATRPEPGQRPRVVVVGSGYAALQTLRFLEARLPADAAALTSLSPTDHLLYTSLLPEVCAGVVEPRHLAVATRGVLKRTVPRLGHAISVNLTERTVTCTDHVANEPSTVGWDRLVLAPGAITRTFDIPGLVEHAVGLKNLAEAAYLRDHVIRQMENADACDDPAQRRARCTFVVVGAGYTGTELAAQMSRFTRREARHFPRLNPDEIRWILLDLKPRVLPELAEALGTRAAGVLAERRVDVRLGCSLAEVAADSVTLTDGSSVPTHTVVWCAGVAPSPLMSTLGLPTTKGRLNVDAMLRVPGADGVFALGDAAAVPDVTKGNAPAGQTAQNALRQGITAGRNVAASLGYGKARPYKHRDLGFVVDLGGTDAVANPLGITLSGLPAAAVTRAYHLYAIGSFTNQLRVASDWTLSALSPTQIVQLGFLRPRDSSIVAAEHTDIYV